MTDTHSDTSAVNQKSAAAPMRLLVTGAGGLIGHALLAAAPVYGFRGVPLHRGRPGSKVQAGAILWEPEQAQPFADLEMIEGFDAVVHLSGANLSAHRWTAAYRKEILDSRTQTTGALALALARLQNPPKVLVTASATGFYGSRGDETLTEESAAGQGFLSEVCQAWESAASPAVAAGIRTVHPRFGVVLTPFGGALRKMLPLFRLGLGGRLGPGTQWMNWITLDDLIRGVFHCIGHAELSGPINLVAPEPVRNAEFTAALAEALRRPAVLPAPAFALRAALGEMADETLLSSCRTIPSRLAGSGFNWKYPGIATALQALVGRSGA